MPDTLNEKREKLVDEQQILKMISQLHQKN